jgi:hypothetical protein
MLLPDSSSATRRRIYTMLGVTMANLDNEVAFVREQLSLAAPGDFCVLDYQLAYAPPEQPERIRQLDPPLSNGVSAHSAWMTGPLRRYCRDATRYEISVDLNTRTQVPGVEPHLQRVVVGAQRVVLRLHDASRGGCSE